jgi:hypothetical protein
MILGAPRRVDISGRVFGSKGGLLEPSVICENALAGGMTVTSRAKGLGVGDWRTEQSGQLSPPPCSVLRL